ncbi:hypothetical protein CITRIK5_70408 [Citricoccus sp. K5]|nr:hypothetical protein CITRIK5_70408 [Citricoccus sp. K5]
MDAAWGLSSTLSLATVILSACSVAISSRMGLSMRQGPHHSAQKSTMTGLSEFRTFSWKSWSVTSMVLMVPPDGFGLECRQGAGIQVCGVRCLDGGRNQFLDVRKVMLDVLGGDASAAGGGDGLTIGRVGDIPGSEDAGKRGARAGVVDPDRAVGIELDLVLDEIGPGIRSDGHEQAGDVQGGLLAGLQVAQVQGLELLLAVEARDLGVPDELDLLVGQGPIGHGLRGTQVITAVDHRDLGRELGEEQGLLHGGVAPAHHGDVLIAEEEAVTRGAPAHAVAGEPLLTLHAELSVGRPRGQDHRMGTVFGTVAEGDDLRRGLQVHRHDVLILDFSAESGGLLFQVGHQFRTEDALREAGEVLHVGGVHQLTAGGHGPCDHEGIQVRACSVDGGGVARRARSDDDDVPDGVDGLWSLGHGDSFRGRQLELLTVEHPPAETYSKPVPVQQMSWHDLDGPSSPGRHGDSRAITPTILGRVRWTQRRVFRPAEAADPARRAPVS